MVISFPNKVIKVNPLNPPPDLIKKAAETITNGGVVIFPTRYLYGLGADALNPDAVERVYQIKQRPLTKPLLILVKQPESFHQLVQQIPENARQLMGRFWPGDVTLVFEANDSLPQNLTAGTGKIGVRLPQHPTAIELTNAVQNPITATSANLAGLGGCSRIADLDPLITDNVDLILDAGTLKGGSGSTIVDVTVDPPVILREGAVPASDIWAVLDNS